jgi:hypothetical protein
MSRRTKRLRARRKMSHATKRLNPVQAASDVVAASNAMGALYKRVERVYLLTSRGGPSYRQINRTLDSALRRMAAAEDLDNAASLLRVTE